MYYDPLFWESVGAQNRTLLQNNWTDHYGATDPIDLMMRNNMFNIIPQGESDWVMPEDPSDYALMRTELQPIVNNASWQMVFASSEDEFNRIWNDMKDLAMQMGWETLFEYDKGLAMDMFAAMP